MIKIKRFKHINEDDLVVNNQVQQPVLLQPALTAQPAPATVSQPAATPQAQPQVNQLQQVNNTQQPATDNQQTLQQPVLQPTNNYQEKVLLLLDNNHMGNTYWIMSVDIPSEIQKEIPDFKKGNQQADESIKAWENFKGSPNENTFKAFVDAFAKFGNNQTNNAQQQNPQPALQQTPVNPQPTTNVNASYDAGFNFKQKLVENLLIANKKNYYRNVLSNYFGEEKMK